MLCARDTELPRVWGMTSLVSKRCQPNLTGQHGCRCATEMCDALDGGSRRDCYASVGVDVDRVDEYLGRTLCLESALNGVPTLLVPRLCRMSLRPSVHAAECLRVCVRFSQVLVRCSQ